MELVGITKEFMEARKAKDNHKAIDFCDGAVFWETPDGKANGQDAVMEFWGKIDSKDKPNITWSEFEQVGDNKVKREGKIKKMMMTFTINHEFIFINGKISHCKIAKA